MPHLSFKSFITVIVAVTFVTSSALTATAIYFAGWFAGSDVTKLNLPGRSPVPSEEIYLLYEETEVLTERPNGLNERRISGYARSLTGEEHLVYSFVDDPFSRPEALRTAVPTASIMPDNTIFLDGVGDTGFVVLNVYGDNLSSEYSFFSNRSIVASQSYLTRDREYLYYTKSAAAVSGGAAATAEERARIYRLKLEDGTEREITHESLPDGLSTLVPVGESEDGGRIYFEKRGAENDPFAQVWQLDAASLELRDLENVRGSRESQVAVCPREELIIRIGSAADPARDAPAAPSRLEIIDLGTDHHTVLAKSDEELYTDLAVSCAAQKMAYSNGMTYGNGAKTRIQDFDNGFETINLTGVITRLADDGTHVIMKETLFESPIKFSLYNLEKSVKKFSALETEKNKATRFVGFIRE